MITVTKLGVRLSFSKADYARESLEAAARVLPAGVQVFLEEKVSSRRAELRSPGAASSAACTSVLETKIAATSSFIMAEH